ncbi:MAG: twin-arginine translocation signal domain-containing protein [Betaproteobacteria bacterium]|nr:twin-arginine translocation signal domain-containing protein [Betaproteobacteria bacterium]
MRKVKAASPKSSAPANPSRRGLLKASLAAGASAAIVTSKTSQAQGAGIRRPVPIRARG